MTVMGIKRPARPAAAGSGQNAQVSEQARCELVELLQVQAGSLEGSIETPIVGLSIHRIMRVSGPHHHLQTAALALIAQGSKRLLIGDEVYTYDPLHYMVSSVDLPVVAQIRTASPTTPYLGLRLRLDLETLGSLIRDENLPPMPRSDPARGLVVNPLRPELLDAVLRLLRLLSTPRDIPILAPLIQREILYRLLMDGQGVRMRQIALLDSHTQRVAKAISLLRQHFAEPLRIEAIAREVHMSVSSLHHHFKSVTAMSPLQYQKQLRLQEARRLMFMADLDIAITAHRVGYESPSQFSREYGRLYGISPRQDKRRFLDRLMTP